MKKSKNKKVPLMEPAAHQMMNYYLQAQSAKDFGREHPFSDCHF